MIIYRTVRTNPKGVMVWERFSKTKHRFYATVGNLRMKYTSSFGTITIEVMVIPSDHIIEIDRYTSEWEKIDI